MKFQIVDNSKLRQITFHEAMLQYKQGKVIECRIIKDDVIVEWEKYHISEGLDIALEFNEIINGTWFVDENYSVFLDDLLNDIGSPQPFEIKKKY